MRPVALSMRGAPPPHPAARLVAAAAVGTAVGGAAGWSLARWQQRQQQQQEAAPSIQTEEEVAREAELRRQADQLLNLMVASRTPAETPLHDAAVVDDVEGARKALAAAPHPRDAALAKNKKGHTALLLAAVHGSDQVARLLLEAAPEAAMMPCNDECWLPVHVGETTGCWRGQKKPWCVCGCDGSAALLSLNQRTVMHPSTHAVGCPTCDAAAQEGYTDVMKLLLGAVPECVTGETASGWTAATLATRHGHAAAL